MGANRILLRLAISLSVLTAPAAAAAQSTVLIFQSEPGDYIGQGQTATYTPAMSQDFSVERNSRGGLSARIVGPDYDFWWTLDFVAAEGRPLTVGYYPGALRYPFAKVNAMDVSGSGRGCNTLTGRFLVRELVFGLAGEVVSAAVDAEQHCSDMTPALFVALRYNSSVPTDLFPGSIGQYAIRITQAAQGLVTGDGISCGGFLNACDVVFGSATTATLTAVPNSGYMFTGWTGACSGGETTTVNVNMVRDCAATFEPVIPMNPRTLLQTSSAAGDYIGQGRDEVFSSQNSSWQVYLSGSSLTVNVSGAGPRTSTDIVVRITPPEGQLIYGQWYETTRFGGGGFGGLSVSSTGRGCSEAHGRYRIHEWRVDPVTLLAVRGLALDFEQHCESPTAPLLRGTLHYSATFEIPPSEPPIEVPGPATCPAPDPFAALGGGTCYNGGWLPPGMAPPDQNTPPPSTPPSSTPPPTSTCSTPDPFAALGGGVCYNGGWLPPGMSPPGEGSTPPPPSPSPAPAPATPPAGCTTLDPFAAIGGGTCYNGGWLPPGMPVPGGSTPPPSPEPPPSAPPPTGCTTADPFAVLGGGTCYGGGWLPPGMAIPGGGG